MDHRISIEKRENFVHAYIIGPISQELLAEFMKKTSMKGKKWGFNRYIADLRQAEKQMSMVKDYNFAYRKAEEYGFKPGTSKHALIVRHEDIDDFAFIETVFQNAGHNLRIFTDEDAAFDWIRK